MIKVSNLNKYYNKGKSNEIHVINDTSLVLPNTGLIAFLGQSGSGKTTLINVIAGLDKAKGEISYDEEIFTNYKANKIDKFRVENIGYVFQNYNLLSDRTVYENLSLALNLIGLRDVSQIDERIDYVLDQLKIKKYKNRLAGNLSGGQMQRVSIARALVKDSKIIICDEPTGNLDSENTIEVMNILKAISKNRLVVLVTHDKKNASFYADRIVEIKDGSVISDNLNDSVNSLDTKNTDNIYLLDLKSKEYNNDNLGIKVYSDDGEGLNDLNITIVKANGNIYLKCDGVNYLTNDSKVKLINDNYKEMSKKEVDSLEFNPKPFNYKKKFSFKPIINSFKTAWFNFRNVGKKAKWLNSCFVIIGIIMAIAVLVLSSSQTADKSKIPSYKDAYVVQFKYEDYDDFKKYYYDAVDKGYVDDIFTTKSFNLNVNPAIDDDLYASSNSLAVHHYNYITNEKIKAGITNPGNNEIVITTKVADDFNKRLRKFMNLKYEEFVGLSLTQGWDGPKYKIVGVIESDNYDCYLNVYGVEFEHINKYDYSYLPFGEIIIDDANYHDYDIILGNDISSSDEVLIDYQNYISNPTYYKIGNTIDFDSIYSKKIVGVFTSNGNHRVDYLSIDNSFIKAFCPTSTGFNYYTSYMEKELASGRLPKTEKEVILPEYLKFDTDTQEGFNMMGYTVVGYYKSSIFENKIITSKEAILKNRVNDSYIGSIVLTKNKDGLADLFKDTDYKVLSYKDYSYSLQIKDNKTKLASVFGIVGVFTAVVFVYTYFIMRSKMIHRIYEIGVLREIGASKKKMYGSFLAEILVSTTFSTVISYVLVLVLFAFANKKMGNMISLFHISGLYATLGVIVLYLASIISGLLPIFFLLRKTPSEIVAKYDL